jgi:radical SAM superfamily enzyme YgiQ (UPF0313 family)
MLIYLADTVHRARQINPDTVPYNVARIAAYTQSRSPEHEYRIFKDPVVVLDELRRRPPDVLALSHYYWNTKLNHRIARYAKELNRNTVIVTGGPNLDRNRDAYIRYSAQHPHVDFVVVEEGETGFANIVAALANGNDLNAIKSTQVPGTFAVLGAGEIHVSASLPRVRNLDEFPSPYLNGMLDEFLQMGLRPILETVRGCPYQCAFCEQGSEFFTKLSRLSEDRVFAEIDYIRPRTSAPQLILADVNFGILKRDLQVARFLKQSHEEHAWPKSVYVYNAKLPTESTLSAMETLYPMAQICMSFQSTDETVLDNIHRANIGYDKYSYITRWAKERNMRVGTELIYGLPGETLDSFIQGYEKLLNFRADYMASYNLFLFPGIELNTPQKRAEYGVQTRFRPITINLGEYELAERERIIEIEEIVLSNSTLSEDDFFRARRMGFMVEALWNTGYLRPALVFLANHGFKVTSVLQSILDEGCTSSAADFFNEYDELARGELVSDPSEFDRRSAKSDYWNDMVNGRGVNVKINLAFAGRLLLFDNPFDEFFYDFLYQRYADKLSAADRSIFEQVLAHCRASKVDLEKPETRHLQLSFDVPEWIQATYPIDTAPFRLEHPVEYTYAVDPDVLATALRTKARLESYGARLLNIAEHIFNEIPSFHRGARAAVRKELPAGILAGSDALEQRVSWNG